MTERLVAAARDTFRSLEGRNFRLFLAGQAISQIGTWLQFVAQTLLVLQLTHSGLAVGLVTAAQFVPILVLGAWAGVITDRVDRRRLLAVTQTSMMACALVLGALALTGLATAVWVGVIALLTGLANAFDNPARRVLVYELVSERHLTNAVSLNATVMTSARVVGPAVAGLLVATVGVGWCFVLNGVSFLAVLGSLWLMDPRGMRPTTLARRGEKGQLRAGLRHVWATDELRVPLLLLGVTGTLGYNFAVLMPLFGMRDLDGGSASYTVLLSVMSVGSVIGSLWLARRRTVDSRILAGGAVGLGAASVLLAGSPTLLLASLSCVLVGMTSIVVLSGTNAALQLGSRADMRGRVLAIYTVVFFGGTAIGGPIAGLAAELAGARVALGVGAAACILAGAATLLSTRRRPATLALEASPEAPILKAA